VAEEQDEPEVHVGVAVAARDVDPVESGNASGEELDLEGVVHVGARRGDAEPGAGAHLGGVVRRFEEGVGDPQVAVLVTSQVDSSCGPSGPP
jgi:hypothetical protein